MDDTFNTFVPLICTTRNRAYLLFLNCCLSLVKLVLRKYPFPCLGPKFEHFDVRRRAEFPIKQEFLFFSVKHLTNHVQIVIIYT